MIDKEMKRISLDIILNRLKADMEYTIDGMPDDWGASHIRAALKAYVDTMNQFAPEKAARKEVMEEAKHSSLFR